VGKVTSKLQLTVPKAIADQFGIRPGDDLQWLPAGEVIRIIPRRKQSAALTPSLEDRVELFDQATLRQQQREALRPKRAQSSRRRSRGWKREDLYRRGHSR